MTVALCEALGGSPRNRTESAQAHRIMNKGQRAYVEPHTCCERNAPFTVAMRINGRASAIPDRSVLASRRKLQKAEAKETTNTNGHSARSCSTRSGGSLSVMSATTAQTSGRVSKKIESKATAGRDFRLKKYRTAPPRKALIRQIICGSSYTASKSGNGGRRRSAAN